MINNTIMPNKRPDASGFGFIYGLQNPENPDGVIKIGRTYNMWSANEDGRWRGRINNYPATSKWLFCFRVQNQTAAENLVKKHFSTIYKPHNGAPERFICGDYLKVVTEVRRLLFSERQLLKDIRNFPQTKEESYHNKDQVKRIFEGKDAANKSADKLIKRNAFIEFDKFLQKSTEELDGLFKWSYGNVFGLPSLQYARGDESTLRKMFCIWYILTYKDNMDLWTISFAEEFAKTFNPKAFPYSSEPNAFIVKTDAMLY